MLRLSTLAEIIRFQETRFDSLLSSQLIRLCMICIGIGGMYVITAYFPQFRYPYSYLVVSEHFWLDVLRFWPAYVAAVVLNLVAVTFDRPLPSFFDEKFYSQNMNISVGAGLTEEGWFRGIAPFYYGLAVLGLDWLLGSKFGLTAVIAAGLLALLVALVSVVRAKTADDTEVPAPIRINRLVVFLACVLTVAGYVLFPAHPITGLTRQVFYPVIDTISFGLMHDVLFGGYPPMIVMGMIFANFAFRDGHKYQGWVGWTMSWWLGCVFIYATLTYGIFVAIVVHAIFDAVVCTLIYLGQKLKPEPEIIPDIRLGREMI